MTMPTGHTAPNTYATRVEKHCERAKVSTFLCEQNSAKGYFVVGTKHARDAINELEKAIAELKAILPSQKRAV